jgi:MFS family permease
MQSESQTTVPFQQRHPVGSFTVFRQANFRWFFLGTILANCATWTQDVTLSWLVYDLTASGAMLGTMSLVRTIATLGLSPMAGIAIDRRSRRSLMFLTNSWFLVINAGIGLALLAGITQVWPLLLFSLLTGIAQAIDLPLRQTVLFVLVPRRLTPSALGINQTGWAVMRTLGPAIGAFLLVRMGAGGSFLIQAAIYAIIILTIVQLHFPPQQPSGPGTAVSSNFSEGFRHIVKNANTRAFAFMGCILRFFIIPVFIVMPAIFAKDLFQGGPQILGWLLSAIGLGGVLGGLVATSLIKADHRGKLELGAMLLLGLSLVGFAFSTQLWVALVFFGLAGFFEMIFLITNQTLLQLSIPDELRGRVNGIITLSSGLMPLGALIAGIGADTIGPRLTTALLGGSAASIIVIVFVASPTIRGYRLSQALVSEGTR